MIDGLKLDFSTEELRHHLTNRASHHGERRKFYEQQAEALKSGGAKSQDYTGGDPIKSLQDSAKQHANRESLFLVMASHLISGETYRLSEDDLMRLELIGSRYGW